MAFRERVTRFSMQSDDTSPNRGGRAFIDHVRDQVNVLRADGFYKSERIMASPQSARVGLVDGSQVLNFCANNYLGLANDPRLIAAARQGMDEAGFGLASVRLLCGTPSGHKRLAVGLAKFMKMEDARL